MSTISTLERLFRYKADANREIVGAMRLLHDDSAAREISIRTLHHTYVVDRIFAANLSGGTHGYASPNTVDAPTVEELASAVAGSDQAYIDYVSRLDSGQLTESIDFTFTDGAPGRMSREEMLMHVLIHGAYHRGQVSWIMTENAIGPPADGLAGYLHRSEGPARRRPAAAAGATSTPPAVGLQKMLASAGAGINDTLDGSGQEVSRLQALTNRMRIAVGADAGLGKTLKFNLKGEGFIHIDGGTVTNEDRPADLTLTVSIDDLRAIGQGRLAPMSAVMSGRLRLSSMGVAMSLQSRMQALFSRMPSAA